jgi:hypothetical protein
VVPSAEDATDATAIVVDFCQFPPKLVEIYVPKSKPPLILPALAINVAPSADEATHSQYSIGALVCVQVAPKFVEK